MCEEAYSSQDVWKPERAPPARGGSSGSSVSRLRAR